MNDIRLPGLGPISHETAPNSANAEPASDPAEAFNAVMSRFSNERRQAAAAKPADANRKDGKDGKDSQAPASKSAESNASAHPVARSKPQDADDACADAAAPTATAADAIAQAVVDAAQLAAQNPSLLHGAPVASTGAVQDDPATEAASATDVLAALGGQAKVVGGARADGKKPGESRSPVLVDDDGEAAAQKGAPNKRTPPGAKDTLRINAPVVRPAEFAATDVAQRLAPLADATLKAAVPQAAAAATADTTAQAIATAVSAAGSGTTTYSIAHATVATPVGTTGFATELAQRVVVFAGQKVQRAEIAVTPADLGPIAVSIEVRGQDATLAFAAASHTTRAAIEDALPRLREMLAAQGLQLTGTHVGSEPRRDPYRPARENKSGSPAAASAGISAVPTTAPAVIRRGRNLIDIEV